MEKLIVNPNCKPDEQGYFGEFGGAFIPEMLYKNVEELKTNYLEIIQKPAFQQEFRALLRDYVGRPSPLYYSKKLSAQFNARVYLKREDLNHTGAHKINNTLGQILLAKHLNKKESLQKLEQDSMVLPQPRLVL